MMYCFCSTLFLFLRQHLPASFSSIYVSSHLPASVLLRKHLSFSSLPSADASQRLIMLSYQAMKREICLRSIVLRSSSALMLQASKHRRKKPRICKISKLLLHELRKCDRKRGKRTTALGQTSPQRMLRRTRPSRHPTCSTLESMIGN